MKLPLIFLTLTHVSYESNETEEMFYTDKWSEENADTTIVAHVKAPFVPNYSPNGSMVRMPSIFGMRVELPADDPFGYELVIALNIVVLKSHSTKHGVCIVTPDEQFKVVIYGNHLDKIAQLIFTFTNNCTDGHVVDATNDFIIHFNHKATFHLILPMLPESIHAYKMCVKPKGSLSGTELNPLDDISTWITTEKPPKEYFLPFPVQFEPVSLQVTVIAFLLCLSALFSGLTLGLMSLTPQELELVMKSGSLSEQKYAAKILPIRKKGRIFRKSFTLCFVTGKRHCKRGNFYSFRGVDIWSSSSFGFISRNSNFWGDFTPKYMCQVNIIFK
uniref:CNNM transmembrane domain-containing protein n=1 Tax=Heterorhabditis bacteriophora TaxID=37862 RepID=A0A1I7X4V2_HETBA